MKSKKYIIHFVLVALFIGLAGRVGAFPIYLSALKGTITATPYYGNSSSTTTNHVTTLSVSGKSMMLVLSNQVVLDTAVAPPSDAQIAFDLYRFDLFLTNSSGYYYSLSDNGDGRVRISNIATAFTTNSVGGVTAEKDTLNVYLDLEGIGPDGLYYQYKVGGTGTLAVKINKNTGVASVTFGLKTGGGPGVLRSSNDGVSSGGFAFKGSGLPEWAGTYGAYSVYWANY